MAKALKQIDLEELEKLAAMHATVEEIAAWFDMTPRNWLARYGNQERIKEIIERGRGKGRISLRRTQMQVALKGHPTMLIWLGKQLLGQKDIVIQEHIGETVQTADEAKERLYQRIASIASAQAALLHNRQHAEQTITDEYDSAAAQPAVRKPN